MPWVAALTVLIVGTRGTQDAIANGDTRTLEFVHVHSKETASVTFRRNGSYDHQALAQLNWLLRDWRSDAQTKMDPRLFDIIWEVHRSVGSAEAVHINSAYRSPETNGMLQRRSRAVSKHSQHMNGRAMDFYLPDVDMARVRAVAMRLQKGGVGYYPSSYSAFVHLDSGSVRSWPRMTRDQLVRLFPNEKTVHLPTDNKPLAGYEEAKAEILSRGGSVVGYASLEDEGASAPRKSFWARLFGGGGDEDAEYYKAAAAVPAPRGRTPARNAPQMASAYAPATNSDDGGTRGALAFIAPDGPPSAPLPAARRPRGPQVAALPEAPAAPAEPDAAAPGEVEQTPAPRLALAPVPPRRPDDIVAMATMGYAPMPPSRPVELASVGSVPLPKASDPAESAGPRRGAAAPDERAQLRDLFAAVASQASPVDKARVATTRTQPRSEAPVGVLGAPGAGLKIAFSPGPVPDGGVNRFAGPAVRPLPLLR